MQANVLCLLGLALTLTACCGGSEYSRDESREEAKTVFNLASTLTGGIESNRHHARASVNSQLYPYGRPVAQQQPCATCPSTTYGAADIDEPHGHERSESANASGLDLRGATASHPVGPPQQVPQDFGYRADAIPPQGLGYPAGRPLQQPPPGYGYSEGGNRIGAPPQQPPLGIGYPAQLPPGDYESSLPLAGHYPARAPPQLTNPQFYPGQYLPQYPQPYPPLVQYPQYLGYGPGGVPVTTAGGAAPPFSYQNHHRYPSHNPHVRDHWDHEFKMSTEYKEDGVHKGPFDVLNNHGPFGFGSGYGGGYNGAFNRAGI
ncbi:basic salivary proline-rich protein 2 [Scaptodrosophila lebanonensis]|uniref:Basic salivary proline-rich protein 2 n=1 Tax=Drosophila lebanonensis TaxID=7225 RepID=A0A6J2T3A5_DROLE|nr:basic salivary proline-rich protein 2 [Scaptodrosophila lebanonensis]